MKHGTPRIVLARLALVVSAFVVTLAVGEVFIRLFLPDLVSSAYDEREYFCEFDPLLGWSPIRDLTARHSQEGFSVLVRQNQRGLRAPNSIQPKRETNLRRYLVLGDSYVWGFGVEQHEIMTAPEVHRAQAELINFGVSGYGTDQEYLYYLRAGTEFEVDEVVLVLTPYNDVDANLSAEQYERPKPFLSVDDGKLRLHTDHIRPRRQRPISKLLFQVRIIGLIDTVIKDLIRRVNRNGVPDASHPLARTLSDTDITARDLDGVRLTLQIISALRATAVERGAKLSVIFVPYKPHIQEGVLHNHPLVPLLAAGIVSMGIEYYEPYAHFLKAKQGGAKLFNVGDNHFSPEGNILFARFLVAETERRESLNYYQR